MCGGDAGGSRHLSTLREEEAKGRANHDERRDALGGSKGGVHAHSAYHERGIYDSDCKAVLSGPTYQCPTSKRVAHQRRLLHALCVQDGEQVRRKVRRTEDLSGRSTEVTGCRGVRHYYKSASCTGSLACMREPPQPRMEIMMQ